MNYINSFKTHWYSALSFFIAAIIIVFFLPDKIKFKYNYVKGDQWTYEDLYSPFDYPLYKTEAQLTEEYNEMSKNSPLFYIMDTSLLEIQLQQLKAKLVANDSSSNGFNTLKPQFEFIYNKGIVSDFDKDNQANKDKLVDVVRGSYVKSTLMSELFSISQANKYIQRIIQRDSINIDVKNYIHINIAYNENLTTKAYKSKIGSILPTEGVVFYGEKIISKGDIVGAESYQLLYSLKKEYERTSGISDHLFLLYLGHFIHVLLCLAAIYVILLMFRADFLSVKRNLFFILLLVVSESVLSFLILKINPDLIYIIPFTIVPIYISSFFFSRPALFVHFFTMLLIGFFVPNSFEFVLINSLAAITAVIGFKYSYRRGQIILTAFVTFLTYTISYMSLKFMQEDFSSVDWTHIMFFALSCSLIILFFQFISIFERIFGFVSSSRLIELLNTNHKLLRELSEVAPGTFQHTMQVANLTEAVIREIKGEHLLARVGALYHDIGKMQNPSFFTENQVQGIDPHSNISSEDSAAIIVEHVAAGIALAKKHNLPPKIIDFIKTHHSDSIVYFFYSKYLETHEDKGAETVSKFSYPGPKPFTKEMAVLMMCDSCEAASKSLKQPTKEAIFTLVDKIVDTQMKEGHFFESDITLKELSTAKRVIKEKLNNIYHARIEYPERKN